MATVIVRDLPTPAAPPAVGHLRAVALERTGNERFGFKLRYCLVRLPLLLNFSRTDDNPRGAVVQEVLPEGLAAAKGIHNGDKLVSINEVDITDATHEQVPFLLLSQLDMAKILELLRGQDSLRLLIEPANYRKGAQADILLHRR